MALNDRSMYIPPFLVDKVRVPAYITDNQRTRLKETALKRGYTLQEYLNLILAAVAETGQFPAKRPKPMTK